MNEIQENFDTILSFSVSKWIHLNFGDIGICRFFSKIHALLKDGGYFIFESQDWRSYSKKSCFTDLFKYNKKNI
jgi:7SK snRNA methylphosphate capping enzyme